MSKIKLNIGGQQTIGRFPEGWTCVDILDGADVKVDIQEATLPILTESVRAIYCSHVLEHIWPWKYEFVLSEFYRVLKPGCPVRIVVPDMDIAIDTYLRHRKNPKVFSHIMKWAFDPSLDNEGNLCLNHVGGFNWPLLSSIVAKAGFQNIRRCEYGVHQRVFKDCDNPDHKRSSLYLEGSKK